MFGIGGFELFIILIFGFLIFGPDKLPEIAKTVGKGIARFREAQQEVNETIGDEKLIDLDNPDQPFKDPTEVLDRIAKRQEKKAAGSKAAAGSDASAGNGGATAEADSDGQPKQESFTERKARYERERAARKAAEAEAAKNPPQDAQVEPAGEQPSEPAADSPEPDATSAAADNDSPIADAAATPEPASAEGGDA